MKSGVALKDEVVVAMRRMWEMGHGEEHICEVFGISASTFHKHVRMQTANSARGRPTVHPQSIFDKFEQHLKAQRRKDPTVGWKALHSLFKCGKKKKPCLKLCVKEMGKRGFKPRTSRSGLMLTAAQKATRLAWAEAFEQSPWTPDVVVDIHSEVVPLTSNNLDRHLSLDANRQKVIRRPDEGLDFIQQKATLPVPTGERVRFMTIMLSNGVCGAIPFEVSGNGRWNWEDAMLLYPQVAAFARKNGIRKRIKVLYEDNDTPMSKPCVRHLKEEVLRFDVRRSPSGSPDANPCDFYLHPHLGREFVAYLKDLKKRRKNKPFKTGELRRLCLAQVQKIMKNVPRKTARRALAAGLRGRAAAIRQAAGAEIDG